MAFMMGETRPRKLPAGWYPRSAGGVLEAVEEFEIRAEQFEHAGAAAAVVVPHAGWTFSGALAYAALRALPQRVRCVVVVGGHLRPGDPVLVAPEDRFETPLGSLAAATELRTEVRRRLECRDDRDTDNSVEVQLPLVKRLFPETEVLYLRAPPDKQAIELAETLAELDRARDGGLVVVGSTDLTHYGPNFGFTSHGSASQAIDWVKGENDRRAIDPLLRLEPQLAIDQALRYRAACSMGAGACAAQFGRLRGAGVARLIGHYTSFDLIGGDTIVGYAGITFEYEVEPPERPA